QCPALAVAHPYRVLLGDAVHRQKSHVVRRELVFDSGIAQTDDQLHARSFAKVALAFLLLAFGQKPRAKSSLVISFPFSLASPPSRAWPRPLRLRLPRPPACPS